MNLVPSEGDLADGARVVLVEAVEAGFGGDGRDEIDGGAQRQGLRVDVDAAQAEAVADEVLDGVGVGAEALQPADYAFAMGMVRALLPDLGADAGPLPATSRVAGAGHALAVAASVAG